MTLYPFLIGSGGFNSVIATGGTITTEIISGKLWQVHTFTSTGDFIIANPGQYGTIETFLWGGGGGLGGYTGPGGIAAGRNGGDSGGAAYARNLSLSIFAETLKICVGGAGGPGFLSGGGGGGTAGEGVIFSSINYYYGGRGGNAGPSGFSGGGGGGGAASAIIRGTTGLIVASGGGGGGGAERSVQAGDGGGGGTNGTSGSSGGGGTVGSSGSVNGSQGQDAGGDASAGGGGGGGVAGGGAGGAAGGDFQGGGGGGGGTSTAGIGTGTNVVNGGVITVGDDGYTTYNSSGTYGRGAGGGYLPTYPNANSGLVVIRYPLQQL